MYAISVIRHSFTKMERSGLQANEQSISILQVTQHGVHKKIGTMLMKTAITMTLTMTVRYLTALQALTIRLKKMYSTKTLTHHTGSST